MNQAQKRDVVVNGNVMFVCLFLYANDMLFLNLLYFYQVFFQIAHPFPSILLKHSESMSLNASSSRCYKVFDHA